MSTIISTCQNANMAIQCLEPQAYIPKRRTLIQVLPLTARHKSVSKSIAFRQVQNKCRQVIPLTDCETLLYQIKLTGDVAQ